MKFAYSADTGQTMPFFRTLGIGCRIEVNESSIFYKKRIPNKSYKDICISYSPCRVLFIVNSQQGDGSVSYIRGERSMKKSKMHPVRTGKNLRMTFSRSKEVLEMPNLIEIQKDSYEWFLHEGLREAFDDISPIQDFAGHLSLEFVDFKLVKDEAKYSIEECKERDATYAAPLKVKVRLFNKDKEEINEHEIFMGDLPLMTENGSFVINGAERVIVSQLVRSPGIYYGVDHDKVGKELYSCTIIPNRGAWIEYETDSNDIFFVRVDRTRKVPVTVFIRALGVGSSKEILDLFGDDPKLQASIEKDPSENYQEGLLELYKKIRPGEPLSVDSAQSLLNSMFFDPRRYDLAKVGRYKFNKKLHLKNRIKGHTLAEAVYSTETGELLAEAGTMVSKELATTIQDAAVPFVMIDGPTRTEKVLSSMQVDIRAWIPEEIDPEELGINELVYYPALKALLEEVGEQGVESLKEAIRKNIHSLIPKHITKEDIFASISYALNIDEEIGTPDDIDHLGNRRIRAVGELLANQVRLGLSRMERNVRERMSVQDNEVLTPQQIINIRPVTAAVKEFFGSSQLSQFMDQHNPLSELSHKRRLSALGPGGLTRDRAGYEVRDVHYTHYGRMCPIETPEGPNIGLINNLSSYGHLNKYGFVQTPYRKVDRETGVVTNEIVWLTADEEDEFTVAQANSRLNEDGTFAEKVVMGRHQGVNQEYPANVVDYMDVSPKQVVAVATACIPFLENDDSNRALMGANMQRQAVPLINPQAPYVGTGMEYQAAHDSGAAVIAQYDGKVTYADADKVEVRREDGSLDVYHIQKFRRSNSGTAYNQRTLVKVGDVVEKGDFIADGPSMENGEMALGQNPIVAYMTWEGYNFEDAVIMSERLVKDDVYTSVHLEEYESETRDTKLGPEEITREIPNVGEDALKDLDEMGIIRIGAEVKEGDILVGKVTPKGEKDLSAEERLLHAIFGDKSREVRDTSLRVPHGADGVVRDVKIFTRANGDELQSGVNMLVRVYIAQKRKIKVGDKMAGRHGNKGVVSRIVPVEDMPYLPDGTPVDIMLNPLGVPSRMNIGQVMELHLGMAARTLGIHIATPVFDGASSEDLWSTVKEAGMDSDAKTILYDGRTGEPFDNRVSVGVMYMIKLHHMVDDKLHARSVGPYSTVTQQPLGGKAQFGGQRFGEMEVWALEAYGASNVLQEILTYKSDDINGRLKAYEAITKGKPIPKPGVPESFRVLVKELQSLGLDMRVLDEDDQEVELRDLDEGMDEDVIHVDDLEKAREKAAQEAKAAFEAEEAEKEAKAEETEEAAAQE